MLAQLNESIDSTLVAVELSKCSGDKRLFKTALLCRGNSVSLPRHHHLKKGMKRVGCVIEDFVSHSVYCFCMIFWEMGLCAASWPLWRVWLCSSQTSDKTRIQWRGLVHFQSELGRHCSGSFLFLTLNPSAAEKVTAGPCYIQPPHSPKKRGFGLFPCQGVWSRVLAPLICSGFDSGCSMIVLSLCSHVQLWGCNTKVGFIISIQTHFLFVSMDKYKRCNVSKIICSILLCSVRMKRQVFF